MFEKRSDLRKFLTVAETGTVLGAADRMAMTQPALSRAIARLEASFGGKLFERLPTTFLDKLPELRLKPLPLEFGRIRFRAGLVSRVSAWDFSAFRYFAETVRDLTRGKRGHLRPITAA